jgi:hypothetical protein
MRPSILLVLIAALCGCGEKTPEAPTSKQPVHEHHAPHGGALQVLGEEAAHVELMLDAATGKLTAYVLDGEAEKPVRVAQDALRLKIVGVAGGDAVVEMKAVANDLTGEKIGDTSQFEGASEELRGATQFKGVLESITARGVTFDAVPIGYPGGNESEEKHDVRK